MCNENACLDDKFNIFSIEYLQSTVVSRINGHIFQKDEYWSSDQRAMWKTQSESERATASLRRAIYKCLKRCIKQQAAHHNDRSRASGGWGGRLLSVSSYFLPQERFNVGGSDWTAGVPCGSRAAHPPNHSTGRFAR